MPKLWFDAQAERATSTLGRQRRVVERLRTAASADLDAARERVERVRRLDVALPTSGLPASKCVLAFDRVSFAWPGGRPLLEDVSFQLVGPRRLALTGPNGSGKTTLIRLAIGELDPSSGAVRRNVAGALLDQRAALLDDRLTLVENFRRLNGSASEGAAHAALAQFLFRNVEALKPAGALSGGERLRAALACALMADPAPQLIILDEPTNHLDLESIAAIETALSAYDGALLVVSHDQAFLGAIGVDAELRLGAGRPD
jgi:ATPase subunit of ABC transporter with duplicated ATPase domains